MIPVSLRVKNFLSYGTAADELDFGAFHVACLSGGNGQGKSALLDAVTWAIWGEARKTSGAQKPDEDLIRVGTRDMEVELVFDLEHTRYRVTRTYHRSASGKTSKPGLEFHLFDPESSDYRPLTAGSVRDTQALIHARVGIDYETFINSAFLLQGRSDEFTKKKPAERKEILGRILGLDRYERLAQRASRRYSEAREHVKRYESTVERLKEAVAEEREWKDEHENTQKTVEQLEVARIERQQAEAGLREKLSALDAVARQAAEQRETLGRLATRRTRLDEAAATLATRIAEADKLVTRSEVIEQDHARYERLLAERDQLDEKATLRRGIEHQAQEQRLALERVKMEHEGKIERKRTEVELDKKRLADDGQRIHYERPRVEEELERSRRATEELARLQERRLARERLIDRREALDKQLDAERNRITGTITALTVQVREAEEAIGSVKELQLQARALAERVSEVEAWQTRLENVREAGTGAKADVSALEAERDRLGHELDQLSERIERLQSLHDEACPTCGTALTPAHRSTVEATYRQEQDALKKQVASIQEKLEAAEQRRTTLREQYAALREKLAAANGVATKLGRIEHQLSQGEEAQRSLAEKKAEAGRLQRLLDKSAYRPEAHAARLALQEELDAHPFDEAAFQDVQREADRLADRKARLEELKTLAERRSSIQQKLHANETELATLSADLESGSVLGPLQRKIADLERQLAEVGYDGEHHKAVRDSLEALREAPRLFARLMEAQRNLTDWSRRKAELAEEQEGVRAESEAVSQSLAATSEALQARPALEAQHAAAGEASRNAEKELGEAQARLGMLAERLQRCADDRAVLKETRVALKEAKSQAALYRHLRGAFGTHGIPSLIIEETLPELEDRANELLVRLSKGRTRVTLETLKEKKSGGTKETLDIRITDEQGVARSYETFSGGEAFRVNFALRIALAQLLAERSGVRIRTLVIDEGFGTQDPDGIGRLIEAIHAIQDDFDKMLVITHLEELKSAFPIRIEVTKRPVEGSTFELVGI